jgi:hypothetical protein
MQCSQFGQTLILVRNTGQCKQLISEPQQQSLEGDFLHVTDFCGNQETVPEYSSQAGWTRS